MKRYRPMHKKRNRGRMPTIIQPMEYTLKYKNKVITFFLNGQYYTSFNISDINEHKLLYIFSIILRQINVLERKVPHREIRSRITTIHQTHDIFYN